MFFAWNFYWFYIFPWFQCRLRTRNSRLFRWRLKKFSNLSSRLIQIPSHLTISQGNIPNVFLAFAQWYSTFWFHSNRDNGWSEEDVLKIIISLQTRGLIKSMEFNSFTRIHHEDKEIKVVKQMPTIASNKQPTIAVITAQYCEKVAVDSMLENKETFVRYTTVG